ncbi:MAG: TonB-dependent receptor [Bacteroidota bacterium]
MKYLGLFLFLSACLCWPLSGVSQSGQPADDTLDLRTVVVTAQFAPTDSRETVNSVRILDQKTIEKKAAVNLLELLQTEANLRISQDAIFGGGLEINGLRSESVKILVDGVPVIGRLDGNIDLGQLPIQSVRQVEIIEGAQSLIYGSAASAGVVNLVTKSSQLHQLEGEVTGLTESNGFRSLNARAGTNMGKTSLSINGGTLRFEPDGDTTRNQLWNPKEQKTARVLFTFSPNKNLNLRATGSHFSEEVTNLGEIRRPQFMPYAFDEYYRTTRNDLNLNGDGWLPGNLYWRATAGYNHFNRKRNNYRYDFESDTSELVTGAGVQDTSIFTGLLFRGTLASSRKDRDWDFLSGIEIYRETGSGGRILDTAKSENDFATAADLAVFGSLKYRFFKTFTVQGGARLTHNTRFGTALTPAVWMAWRPNRNWEMKASYANGFRSPSLKELYINFIDISHFIVGNRDLLPEKSHNFRLEINRKQQLENDWTVTLGANGFYNTVEDRIILAEFDELKFNYQNLAKWKTAGSGLTLSAKKWRRLSVRSTFILTGYFNTLSESRDVDELSWSPDWANDVSFEFFESKAALTVWHKWTGATPVFLVRDGETVEGEREGWHLLNASVQGQFLKKSLQLTAGVKNILDVTDIRTGGSSDSAHAGGNGRQAVNWGRSFFVQAKIFIHSKK